MLGIFPPVLLGLTDLLLGQDPILCQIMLQPFAQVASSNIMAHRLLEPAKHSTDLFSAFV